MVDYSNGYFYFSTSPLVPRNKQISTTHHDGDTIHDAFVHLHCVVADKPQRTRNTTSASASSSSPATMTTTRSSGAGAGAVPVPVAIVGAAG